MNGKSLAVLILLSLLVLMLAACGRRPDPTPVPPTATPAPTDSLTDSPTAAPTAAPTADPATPAPAVAETLPLYVSLIWHQHQPLYFKEPDTGVYAKPWVRLHATKDYVDMAAILEEYPDIRATFNLTPSLLRQLLDLEAGAMDLYRAYTTIPAAELTDADKEFLHTRFFDINPKIIARFPRYQELADGRDAGATWTEQDWRDLQVLFNLGWTDPDYLAQAPLADLVTRGRDFSEADKATILAEHDRLVAEVIPLHKRLQDDGRIEVTTTPFFHPILPLLLDSNLAAQAVPDIDLPPRYTYGIDAVNQVKMGVDFYAELFDRAPTGMWPAEGAVAQEIVGMVADAGITWMATDEEVLARSLGMTNFSRDAAETVQDAATLYRPYVAATSKGDSVYVTFRDKTISDKVGFTYSGEPGADAARDFVDRLLAIRAQLAADGALTEPYMVSVILDGENAWEHYENDGKEFLHAMYQLLSEEQTAGTLQTVTPTEFIERYPEQTQLDSLWAGSWVSPDYLTWIGEDEENRAWDYLGQVRKYVQTQQRKLDDATLAAVMDAIYTAEGSDWFWWYGADQNSGDDGSFDEQFRRTLMRVYELTDSPIPDFLRVPVIPAVAPPPALGATGLVSVTVDGVATAEEWRGAGYYTEEGGVQATAEQVVDRLWYGFGTDALYLRLDGRRPWASVADETRLGFYLTRPGSTGEQPFTRVSMLHDGDKTLVGFGANVLAEVTVRGADVAAVLYQVDGRGDYVAVDAAIPVAIDGSIVELALPYALFGRPDAGDAYRLRAVVSEGEQRDVQLAPGAGPAELLAPDLGLSRTLLTVVDPTDDDHGPGTYTYPQDGVFKPGAYDLVEFTVAEDDTNVIFRLVFDGELNNDWGAPNGMGIHTVDVYLDAVEGGARMLLPGRNAAVAAEHAWDLALWAEGWTPGLFAPPAAGTVEPQKLGGVDAFDVITDPGNRKITIRIGKATILDALGVEMESSEMESFDMTGWRVLAVVAGQEGFPSSGVWRIRDVEANAQQWRFGGAPDDTNHTRIIDVAWPADGTPTQEDALSGYPPSSGTAMDALTPDDFAQLPTLEIP